MSYLFISHSSQNDFEAIALQDWLIEQGWDELFLDLDPERGIVAGERWERALHDAASRCDAVLFCVSKRWLDSEWCRKEFRLAHRLNKRIIGILIEDIAIDTLPDELTSTWQLVNLAASNDHQLFRITHPNSGEEKHVHFSKTGLTRLKAGLVKAGLDPLFFDWPPSDDSKRSPYRGMLPLEREDAGIFFGREAPTNELLARLRGLRIDPPPRFMVVLGASGAGKSSFLRAGVLPRLARDERNFLTLPILRPEQSVLFGEHGFLQSLNTIFDQYQLGTTRGALRNILESDSEINIAQLVDLLKQLSEKAKLPDLEGETRSQSPTLVLTIDQGEELFQSEGSDEAAAFLDILKQLATNSELPLIILFTIRSDTYEQLQTHSSLEGLTQQTFSLTPMPQGSYQHVIEGPAARLKDSDRPLEIEPALTQKLMEDIEKGGNKDSLPLLAFTLERLYLEYGGDGDLTLEEYNLMGGLEGAIEAAVERAIKSAVKDSALPNERKAITDLLRRGLIPWLAGIDPDSQAPRRRVAKLSEIPQEARPIISHLIEQRLLATDIDESTNETTLEPAHEALLRQWGLLQGWLKEDFVALTTLESVQRASRDWSANNEGTDWLAHSAGRLEDAEQLKERSDLSLFLKQTDWNYLKACRELENEKRDKELAEAKKLAVAQKKIMNRTVVGLIVTFFLLITAVYLIFEAVSAKHDAEIANRDKDVQLVEATHNFGLALLEKAKLAQDKKDFSKAALFSAHALLKLQKQFDRNEANKLWQLAKHQSNALWSSTKKEHLADYVISVAFSPDGKYLARAGSKSFTLWELTSGKVITTLTGHRYGVSSVAFSPDGKRLVSGASDGLKLWDVSSGNVIATFADFMWNATSVAFSPDGKSLVSGYEDSTIKLWDVVSGQKIATLTGHKWGVSGVAFSPDGKSLVSGSWDKTIKLWDVATSQVTTTFIGHTQRVSSVVFTPDGKYLVSGSWDKTIKLWDVDTGQVTATLTGHTEDVISIAISPDGKRLVSGAEDNTIKLWDMATGQLTASLTGHTQKVSSVAFTPDGKHLVSGSWDSTLKLWDTPTGQVTATLTGHKGSVASLSASPDGERLVSGSGDNTLKLWDAPTGKLMATLTSHMRDITSVSFSPNGKHLISASKDKTIKLWNVATGQLTTTLTGHKDRVWSVAFSPDSNHLVSGSADKTIKLWNLTTGQVITTLNGHSKSITSVAFTPDGKGLASGSWDKTIKLWNVTTGQVTSTLTGHEGNVTSLSFSPNGKLLLSGSEENNLKLWDVATGQLMATLSGHKDAVTSVTFSPDGKHLISGSWDKTIKLWDVDTGQVKATLAGHSERVRSVAFLPDGKRMASGASDNTINLWDVESYLDIKETSAISSWINQQTLLKGFYLDGLTIKIRTEESNHSSLKPNWSKNDSYYWFKSVEEGNSDAMLQLGIIFHRDGNNEKANYWYQKALKAGHLNAKERLEVLKQTIKAQESFTD